MKTTLARVAALARAASQEIRRHRRIAEIERVVGPLRMTDAVTMEAAREAHGPMLDALLAARSHPRVTPPAIAVTVSIDGVPAFHLDETDTCLAPALHEEPAVMGALASALAFITAKPGPLAG